MDQGFHLHYWQLCGEPHCGFPLGGEGPVPLTQSVHLHQGMRKSQDLATQPWGDWQGHFLNFPYQPNLNLHASEDASWWFTSLWLSFLSAQNTLLCSLICPSDPARLLLSCLQGCSCFLCMQVYLNSLVFLLLKGQSVKSRNTISGRLKERTDTTEGREICAKPRDTETRQKGPWMCRVGTSELWPKREDLRGDRFS